MKQNLILALLSAVAVAGAATDVHASSFTSNNPAYPDIRITEFMYKNENSPGEFVQFTNLGSTAVNMSGWSEDDAAGKSGTHSLSSFGTLQPGQSAILAQATQSAFDTAWNLSSSGAYAVENSSDNLSSADSIYLFDASGDVVDLLQYSTTLKSDGTAVIPDSAAVIGTNDYAAWELVTTSTPGAIHANGSGDLGTPGYSQYAVTAVPAPATAWFLASGIGALVPVLRRRRQAARKS